MSRVTDALLIICTPAGVACHLGCAGGTLAALKTVARSAREASWETKAEVLTHVTLAPALEALRIFRLADVSFAVARFSSTFPSAH